MVGKLWDAVVARVRLREGVCGDMVVMRVMGDWGFFFVEGSCS